MHLKSIPNFFLLLMIFVQLLSFPLEAARVSRSFGNNSSVRVISDKGFSYPETKKFEASGNVVISHGSDAIYGEKATLDMINNKIEVIGNVRFIGPDVTFYGSRLNYNPKKREFEIFNARVLSDEFIVLGKKITKLKSSKIFAEGAEYTTCRDCPESWTVFGKEVVITPHKYIQIKHAYLKAKDVVFMYIPYILFPIKTKRETGILVPKVSFESKEGLYFQQPFFWAIDRSSDMTITPSYFGQRGLGTELEYRKVFSPKKWMEFSTLMVNDTIYQPGNSTVDENTQSGKKYLRYYSTFEYHYDITNRLQHHSYITAARDGDMSRIFDRYVGTKELGSEQQVRTFFDYRGNVFQFDAQATFNRNLIFNSADSFDNGYVQQTPRVSFNMLPVTIYNNSSVFFHNFSFGFDFDYNNFKQNNTAELTYYRNAKRVSYTPYLNMSWGQIGPTYLSSRVSLDGQKYSFPSHGDKTFSKYSVLVTTEMSLELEKFWGKASQKKKLVKNDTQLKGKHDLLVGSIPVVAVEGNKYEIEKQSALKHSQLILLKHYYTTDSKWSGDTNFYNQIQDEEGVFDYRDSLIEKNYLLSDDFSRTSIPLTNTLELQWNHSLTEKSISQQIEVNGSPTYQYVYNRIAYFDLSQGYIFDAEGKFKDHLSRLSLSMGANYGRGSVFLSEYYFYQGSGHIFTTGGSYKFSSLTATAAYNYNYFSVPANKRLTFNVALEPIHLFSFDVQYDYDLESKQVIESNFRLLYAPRNNCWRLSLGYQKTLIKSSYALNFLFNFGGGSFSSFQ